MVAEYVYAWDNDKVGYLILGKLWMGPIFVYDINYVVTKLYMWRHVSGGILCNEYCIRSDHEENYSDFIMSFTVETGFLFIR